jgi:hypothetical protein
VDLFEELRQLFTGSKKSGSIFEIGILDAGWGIGCGIIKINHLL